MESRRGSLGLGASQSNREEVRARSSTRLHAQSAVRAAGVRVAVDAAEAVLMRRGPGIGGNRAAAV